MTPADPPNMSPASPRSLYLIAAFVLLLQGFSIFAPMVVLGGAIQWPDSLDYPPAQMLPLLLEQIDAVRLGYGLYLGYSLLFLITGALTIRLAARPGPLGVLGLIALGAAAASAPDSANGGCGAPPAASSSLRKVRRPERSKNAASPSRSISAK